MAQERVVVCLKASGVDEIVKGAGIVLSSSHPNMLYRAMRSLLQSYPRKRLEKKAYRRSMDFDWNESAADLEKFYSSLLEKKKHSPQTRKSLVNPRAG